MLWHKISFIFIFLSCHFEPFLWSLKKLQIKQDFFKNLGVLKKKLVQNNLELVFFFDFCFLPTWFRAGKAKYLLNLAREFCRICVEQNFRENPRSVLWLNRTKIIPKSTPMKSGSSVHIRILSDKEISSQAITTLSKQCFVLNWIKLQ